jgi:hypothetical protein
MRSLTVHIQMRGRAEQVDSGLLKGVGGKDALLLRQDYGLYTVGRNVNYWFAGNCVT